MSGHAVVPRVFSHTPLIVPETHGASAPGKPLMLQYMSLPGVPIDLDDSRPGVSNQ